MSEAVIILYCRWRQQSDFLLHESTAVLQICADIRHVSQVLHY